MLNRLAYLFDKLRGKDAAPYTMTFEDLLLFYARSFSFVRETDGPNRGAWVGAFQEFTGGSPGDSWCADYLSFVLWLTFRALGEEYAPISRTGSCDQILERAKAVQWLTLKPVVGDVFLLMNNPNDAHHTGFVTKVNYDGVIPISVETIEGNTNLDGSDNGIGVFERTGALARPIKPGHILFVHYPRPAVNPVNLPLPRNLIA